LLFEPGNTAREPPTVNFFYLRSLNKEEGKSKNNYQLTVGRDRGDRELYKKGRTGGAEIL
jgi:hypothetical protein